MSIVKIKNAVLKSLRAAVARGDLPAGVAFDARAREGRLSVSITAAPFDCLPDDKLRIDGHGIGYTVSIFGDDKENYTPQACELLTLVRAISAQAIVDCGAKGRASVYIASDCFMVQGRRIRAERAAAAAQEPHTNAVAF